MSFVKSIAAYTALILLAVCVVSAGIVGANLAPGLLSIPAGAIAAAATFQALRGVTGRAVAAAVESL